MQIKELIIKNFKSFDYVKIPFNNGFYAIVGPNGSGKSNIVDAILFVFGCTSLKRLRVDKLSELINHNTHKNTARVRAVIEHNNKLIEITREIDKDKKSVFYLNNKRKSRHELISYLNEIGIDSESYNTIQQGDVTKIINLSPEDRRKIIDDISGISLFDARKEEAIKNLNKVEKKLEKVNIALNERKPYVEQLKEESENAIRFNELYKKEKEYDYSIFKKEIENLDIEKKKSEKRIIDNKKEIEKIIKSKELLKKELESLKKETEEINLKLISHSEKIQSTIGKEFSDINAKKEIIINNIKINQDNLDYLKKENENTHNLLSDLEKEIKLLNSSILDIKKKLEDKNRNEKILKEEISKKKLEYEKYKSIQKELYSKLDALSKEISKKQEDYFLKKNKLNAFIFQKEALDASKKESNNNIKKLKDKIKEANNLISSLNEKLLNINNKIKIVNKDKEKNNSIKESLIKEINEININVAGLKKELSFSSNFVKHKNELKNILKKYNSFIGFLEDVIVLDKSQKSYFSKYIVLSDDRDIKEIIKNTDFIQDVSFVILSSINITKDKLKSFFENLSNTKIKLDSKLKDFYFDGFCYKKLKIKDSKELESKIKKLMLEKENIEKKRDSIIKIIESMSKEEKKLNEKNTELKIQLSTQKKYLEEAIKKLEFESQNQSKSFSTEKITSNIGQIKNEILLLDKEIIEKNKQKKDLENKIKETSSFTNSALRDKYDLLVSEINKLEQELISSTSNLKSISEKIENKKNYISLNNKKIEDISRIIVNLKDSKTKIEKKLLKLSNEIKQADVIKQNLFTKKSENNLKINRISQNIFSLESKITEINSEINKDNILISTNESRKNQLEQNIRLLDLDKENIKFIDLPIESLKSKQRSIRKEKNNLGNINFNAIESYPKLSKEYYDIKQKSEVLIKEKEEVQAMLSEINLKKETVFMDCFDKVNSNFKVIISEMSKSLSGELELKGDDKISSKLLIKLTKNKKTKNIDIMSGGEKTITALAFIFAILNYKGMAFCILDEVGASLDAQNSLNLLNYIKVLSTKNKTIIAISHNTTVISGADHIIGVTLKDNSSVIGLDLV